MTSTAKLGLPYIITAQAQKEVTHNEALNALDVFVTRVVTDFTNTPPDSPAEGDIHIVGTSPTGTFVGHDNELAQYLTGGWIFYTPYKWLDVVVEARDERYTWDGSAWVPFGLIMKDTGEYLRIQSWQEDVDLSISTQTVNAIPNRATVLAVNTRTITVVTGSVTSFGVGVEGDTTRYGTGIGLAVDATNIGITFNPIGYYADTPIVLTPDKGAFATGLIRINVQYIQAKGPWPWEV